MIKKSISRRTLMSILVIAAFYGLVKVVEFTGIANDYWLRVLDQSLITVIGALGLSIIYGFTGQFSLGHAAFYGIGAYTGGVIGKVWGHGDMLYFMLALVAATLVAGLAALIVGMPILRLRSDYLGIAMLGFGIIVKVIMDNSNKIYEPLGGATGMTGVPQVANFDIIFLFFVVAVFLLRNFIDSSHGRACITVREDEIAADAMGINTTRTKVLAFVLGCALAGLAGGLYSYRYPYVHPTSYDFLKSFDFLLIVVVGGLGSMSGTIVTAIAWVFLLEGLRIVLGQTFVEFRGVIYALILVVTILLKPQGLFSGKELGFLFPKRNKDISKEVEGKHASLGS
ncbi:MAG: branched-chain amino acid ABC transporter permease [Firmicutes bacterium]|nr:branched-chain amino acid ABC transporter permease [Bacillota bacterium]